MILTAHQPSYLPWLGLIHKIALADRFVSFDQVQYVPKDWISRNQILTAQGPIYLTVPCQSKGRFGSTIAKTKINNSINWRKKDWASMSLAYRKSKFFHRYADFFKDTYERDWNYLADLNVHILKWMLNELGVSVVFEAARDYDFHGEKSALVQNMCQQLGAKQYIFGALGRGYADLASFEAAGITVVFQDYRHPEYPQMRPGFTPYMSALDLMFNCGPDSLDILMSGNVTAQKLRRHLK